MTDSDCPIQSVSSNPLGFIENFRQSMGFVPIASPPITTKLHAGFLFPVDYLAKTEVQCIPPHVADDLELFQLNDASAAETRQPIQRLLCQPSNDFGELVLHDLCSHYTTNKEYLEQTQTIIERVKPVQNPFTKDRTARFVEVWKEIKEDKSFLEKHNFMEFVALEEFNRSHTFLGFYSALNIVSPIIGLLYPLILLLLPFVLLKFWGVPMSFSLYLDTLKTVTKQHFIGQLLNFKMDFGSILYTLLIGGAYLMQTYHQVMTCRRFHKTVERMNENLLFLRDFVHDAAVIMRDFSKRNVDLPYYSDFCNDVHSYGAMLTEIVDKMNAGTGITPFGWTPLQKIPEVGHMLHCYYQLYSDMDYEEALRYMVGFVGYLDNMVGIANNSNVSAAIICSENCEEQEEEKEQEQDAETPQKENKDVDNDSFSKDLEDELRGDKKPRYFCEFVDQYHPTTGNQSVKNTVDLSTNMIITGINASGKTTLLKTTALNVLFTQQFGVGFYRSAKLTPFHFVHSYLNIPDTSGRDSLFQAESRRCKEILDVIGAKGEDKRHFCIFDELFSGTNPKEATKTATAFLQYLAALSSSQVRFMLTTHYVGVCEQFETSKEVMNAQMWSERDENNQYHYTYCLQPGICQLEGGLQVLQQMNYPAEIISSIKENLGNP